MSVASYYLLIPAGKSTDTVVANRAGVLVAVVVTTIGTNSPQIYDSNTSGSYTSGVIAQLQASAAIGPTEFDITMQNGILVRGNALNPGMVVYYD